MTKFLEKYSVVDNKKTISRKMSDLSPKEKNRLKLLSAIDDQINYILELSNGNEITLVYNDKIQKPRLFWQDILGGFLFTPRFGNDFLFGKDRGISCSSYDELSVLLNDFKIAVANCEFDDRISEISSARKGRGAGISRNRAKEKTIF